MFLVKLLRRFLFLILYHFYARPKIAKTDITELLGFSLVVPPTVFHPSLYFSSKILGKYVHSLDLKGTAVLDIGCGSGILSLIASSKGASVTAIDINQAAVEATIENAKRNHLEHSIVAFQGNLFEPVRDSEKYDYVFLNPPFYPKEAQNLLEMGWKSGENYSLIKEFVYQAFKYLKPQGKIIFILTSDVDIVKILKIFEAERFTTRCVSTKQNFFEKFFIYEALRIS
ncbi:MAG: methyltransferase [Ignavibacteriae bacterium]|nr:methyltransferase [Ignavibacteriota bacterium]